MDTYEMVVFIVGPWKMYKIDFIYSAYLIPD